MARLGINLPGPFSVSVPLSGGNRHAVECLAGGVIHGNARIAARCRDCRDIQEEFLEAALAHQEWLLSPEGQRWQLKMKMKKKARWPMYLAIVTFLFLNDTTYYVGLFTCPAIWILTYRIFRNSAYDGLRRGPAITAALSTVMFVACVSAVLGH